MEAREIEMQNCRQSWPSGIKILGTIGCLATIFSVLTGIRNAMRYSQDLQWSPTRLLLHHIDPWQYALAGNQGHAIILSQGPNYAHFLYMLLIPLGSMSFPVARIVWAACNLIFSGITLLLVRRIFQQTLIECGITCIIFLCGTPFRNTVGNGQQSLMVISFVSLAFAANDSWSKAIWIGLSYCKYSFAPPYFFDVLISRPYGIVLVTFLPAMIGLLWAYWMLGGHWVHLAVEPLLVGVTRTSSGSSDWMAVVDYSWGDLGNGTVLLLLVKYILPVLASAAVVWYVRHRYDVNTALSNQARTAIYGIAALVLFRHLPYDFVLLVFAFALGLKFWEQTAARWLILGIAYFWFGRKVEYIFFKHYVSELLPLNFLILSSMLIAAMRITCGSSSQSESSDATS